jgi:hypothetical protein
LYLHHGDCTSGRDRERVAEETGLLDVNAEQLRDLVDVSTKLRRSSNRSSNCFRENVVSNSGNTGSTEVR